MTPRPRSRGSETIRDHSSRRHEDCEWKLLTGSPIPPRPLSRSRRKHARLQRDPRLYGSGRKHTGLRRDLRASASPPCRATWSQWHGTTRRRAITNRLGLSDTLYTRCNSRLRRLLHFWTQSTVDRLRYGRQLWQQSFCRRNPFPEWLVILFRYILSPPPRLEL